MSPTHPTLDSLGDMRSGLKRERAGKRAQQISTLLALPQVDLRAPALCHKLRHTSTENKKYFLNRKEGKTLVVSGVRMAAEATLETSSLHRVPAEPPCTSDRATTLTLSGLPSSLLNHR